jgi:hypothetical protein
LLNLRRLPARLTTEQTSRVLGFQPHDIPVLVRCGMLKPLGAVGRNSVKYFASNDVSQKSEDRKWLDRATRIVSRSRSHSDKESDPVCSEAV